MRQTIKQFQTVNMCNFCTKEFPSCDAAPIRAEALDMAPHKLDSGDSVVACNQYENPVEILKKRFHDG